MDKFTYYTGIIQIVTGANLITPVTNTNNSLKITPVFIILCPFTCL